MATKFTIETQYEQVRWLDEEAGEWKLVNSNYYPTLAQRVEIPDSVRRPFPSDPFASATGRVVTKYDTWAPMTDFRLRKWNYRGPLSALYATGAFGTAVSFSHTTCDQKLRAMIKSQTMNALQSVAEIPQTSSMISKLVKDMRTAFRALRPGFAFSNIAASLMRPRTRQERAMANRWLELQYGWKPVLQDIYGVASSLATKVNEGIPMYVHASDQADLVESRDVTASYDGGSYTYTQKHDQTVSIEASARFVVSSSTDKTLAQHGITNPALLAWELIPYSFVADQVIPIGNWLSSFDALVGVKDLVVQRGYKSTNEYLSLGAFGATLYKTDSRVRLGTSSDLAIGWPSPKPTRNMLSLVNDIALLKQLR